MERSGAGKFRYKKGLGQNFMHNTSKLGQMASLIAAGQDETVLEIGPGAGALTQRLLATAGKVIAIEIDTEAIARLKEKIGEPANLEVINADFLEFDIQSRIPHSESRIKVVGNIPYYITTPIIERLIDNKTMIGKAFLTVQKEVGERMAAKEGSKTFGSLSVYCQYHADVKLLLKIDRSSFFPVPNVDSAFVSMDFSKTPMYDVRDEALFFKISRAGFGQRRKMFINNLKRELGIESAALDDAFKTAGIDEKARAETVPIIKFAQLADLLYNRI
jgi:16S rRNA (adenine1518-N6/adenine1519-N6)-dimethyltransferase